jgi:hypothetical protein
VDVERRDDDADGDEGADIIDVGDAVVVEVGVGDMPKRQ